MAQPDWARISAQHCREIIPISHNRIDYLSQLIAAAEMHCNEESPRGPGRQETLAKSNGIGDNWNKEGKNLKETSESKTKPSGTNSDYALVSRADNACRSRTLLITHVSSNQSSLLVAW